MRGILATIITDHIPTMCHRIAAVAEVRKVVRGRPAHVYRHGSLATGNELDLVPSSSVVDAKHELRLASSARRVGRVSMRAISLDHPRVNSATAQTAIPSERQIAPSPSPRLGRIATPMP